METKQVLSKSEFARLVGRDRSAVSHWIRTGVLSGDALVGKGRSAKIDVQVAKAQIATLRKVGQSLGNGLRKVDAATPSERADLETPTEAVCAFLRDLPSLAAHEALYFGMPPSTAYAIERALRITVFGAAKLEYRVEIPNVFAPTDWPAILREFDIDEPVDVKAWEAQRQSWIADREAESDAED